MTRYATLAFTEGVREFQQRAGSARANADRVRATEQPDPLTEQETAFITGREDCWLATVGEGGWPYVQYRGGPPGFVHVLDSHTLALLEVRGNRQYITSGNLTSNARLAMLFLDFAEQRRLKLFGTAELRALTDESLLDSVREPSTGGKPERILMVHVEGYAWNCQQHITQRFTKDELGEALAGVRQRMRSLERENEHLRSRLSEANG